ncbi:TetR-like C-terminal domain-containing protein [Bacillus wiedmannii]|uniref:TetR-like C-terminal domain-containing protein n=1 Tax=Bacillus wiedmannii TaxID=1890302 RepID=UPI002E207971|nr:TetR-like C-terminal domain-containing protein [Bacillus wiedmannii]
MEKKDDVNIKESINKGFSEDMIITFFGYAIVGVVETYFMKGLPDSPEVIAEQLELLLDRNF